jgi:MAF protein
MRTIVLASTSIFRKSLLEKLNIPFLCAKPNIDESAHEGETPEALVKRLAIEKAQAVAAEFPDALIIGSDQVAVHQGQILGKPHNFDNALKQLSQFSGDKVEFLTGLCVYDSKTGVNHALVEPFDVYFKSLTEAEITHYLHQEQPYNCAGSFKSEALGICLFEKLSGDDPNTLIGLPLIKTVSLLKQHGFDVLAQQNNG